MSSSSKKRLHIKQNEILMEADEEGSPVVLGKGGYGVVKKGFLKSRKIMVAVKQLTSFGSTNDLNKMRKEEQTFLAEVSKLMVHPRFNYRK